MKITPSSPVARCLVTLGLGLSLLGCHVRKHGAAHPHPKPIRFVTAAPAQFDAADSQPEIWYEFQPGDEVPLSILFAGKLTGAAPEGVIKAKETFWIVMRKNHPPALSWDGKGPVRGESVHSLLVLFHNPKTDRNEIMVLSFFGSQVGAERFLQEIRRKASQTL